MNLLEKKYVHIVIIVFSGLALYLNTLHVPFYFDDYINILDVPLIKSLSYFTNPASASVFKFHYGGFVQRYVGYLTFALNYRFHGLNVAGYHLVNIAIHVSAALLVYRLVCLTFQTPAFTAARNPESVKNRTGFIALLAALLFVTHPLQTQAVTYLVQRFASLAAMLYLLTLTCYIRARITRHEKGKNTPVSIAWFFAALVSALLAMKTKEIAFTLPFTLLLYEFVFFPGKLKKYLATAAIALAALTGSMFVLSSRFSGGSLGEIISNLDRATKVQTAMSRGDYLATQFRVIVTYLRLTIFPVGQRLDYDYPASSSFFEPAVLFSGLLLCALLAAAIYFLYLSRGKNPAASDNSAIFRLAAFGVFWFFITISIESSIIPIVDVIYEHRMYLPSAGLFIAAAALVSIAGGSGALLPGWPRVPFIAGTAVILLLLSGTTFARNRLWQDEVSFWQDNAAKSPRKARVFHNLGRALENRNDYAGAEEAYRKAADAIGHERADALTSLGLLHIRMGRLQEALTESQAALELEFGAGGAHNNAGMIYGISGKNEEALKEFQLAAHFMPSQAEPHNNIGYVLFKLKRYPEAEQAFKTCLALDPNYERAYVNRGNMFLALHRQSEAAADFSRALKINPSNSEAAIQLQGISGSR